MGLCLTKITWFSCLHRFRKLKSSFKRLSVCTKTKSQRFQIPRVWRALSKSFVFQWRISEDERSNRRKKAAVLVDDNAGSGWSDSKRNFKTSIQISVMITLYACSNSAKLYKKRVQTTWWTSGFSFVYWQYIEPTSAEKLLAIKNKAEIRLPWCTTKFSVRSRYN